MSRAIDWTPLVASGRDPVPGDPDGVEVLGHHYERVAFAIERSAATLRRLAAHEEMRSEAVDAFREQALEAADHVSRAHDRYAAAGRALLGYASVLADAQQQSDLALEEARQAQHDATSAARQVDDALTRLGTAVPGTDLAPLQTDRYRADAAASAAHDALSVAKSRLLRATRARDDAARAAMRALVAVRDVGNLRDNTWDEIVNGIAGFASIADKAALAFGLAALAVGWIPIVGQAFAALLGTAAAVLGVLSLVGNLLLAATHNGDWLDVALGALGTLSFGLGKLGVATFRVSAAGARGAARVKAGADAARSPAAMRSLTPYLQRTGLSRGQARRLAATSRRQNPMWSRAHAATTLRAIPAEIREGAATLLRRESWQRPWSPGNPRHVPDSFAMRLLGEPAGADELARVRGIPPSVASDPAVAAHLRSMEDGKVLSLGAGGYSVVDVIGVQGLYGQVYKNLQPEPPEVLRVPVSDGGRR